MRIFPPMSGVLLLSLTGCPTDKGDSGDSTSTTAMTSEPTGGTPTGDCACFEELEPRGFEVVCPAEVKAEITDDCSSGECILDAAAVDAALAFLATGEPGIVTWALEGESYALVADRTDDLTSPIVGVGLYADCPFSFCSGGLHVVVDGKIFTQTVQEMDLSGERSPLVGATLKEPAFFSECAKNPDVEARFDCVQAAMTAPEFSTCSPGEDLDYY
jgi:hypothetical protein